MSRVIGSATQLELLTRQMASLYFKNRDVFSFFGFFSPSITIQGFQTKDTCHGIEEVKAFFQRNKDHYRGQYELEHEHYEGHEAGESLYVVMAFMNIHTPREEEPVFDQNMMFSIVWHKEKGRWKIIHIHYSITDIMQHISHTKQEGNFYENVNQQLQKAANTDQITKINNMNGFIEECERLIEKYPETTYAIIKFGIRDFRYINRSHGYAYGDKVLTNIAKNLKNSCRYGETCARIEKDIFAVLYKFRNKKAMESRWKETKASLIDHEILCELEMEMNYTAGIYVMEHNDREHVIDMLDKALIAQQSLSKQIRGSFFVFYDEAMMEQRVERSRLLEAITPAMQNDEFQLYIQPQFNIESREIVSGEALCRWKCCDGRIIPPNEFIPLLEENGLILSFDFHMLEKLCEKIKEWLELGLDVKPISVNQSRLHIEQPNYLKDFCATVDRYRIPHKYIAFELTESAFVEQQEEMLKLASKLHKLGFLLAIDDFGTGFASLNLLTVVAADILKIDKSLLDGVTSNRRSRLIIKKVVEMAHDIDMTVICEGIEKEEQLEYLKRVKCDIGQGYLVGKPIPAEDFQTYLKESKKGHRFFGFKL